MNQLAEQIVIFLFMQNAIEKDEIEAYQYVYACVLSEVAKTILLILCGICTDSVGITMVFIIVFVTMRSCCGGYHAKSKTMCMILTLLCWCMAILGAACGEIVPNVSVGKLILMFDLIIIFLFAPQEHINKSLSDDVKKKSRKKAVILCLVYSSFIYLFQTTVLGSVIFITLNETVVLMLLKGRVRDGENQVSG